jgi:hypothetical protein
MRRGTLVWAIGCLVGFVALAVWLYGQRQSRRQPPSKHADRIPQVTKRVADQAEDSARAVTTYHPKIAARIDDLNTPVVQLLRQLPGGVQVEVGVQVEKPMCRIVHLRDWHFVPEELYALELQQTSGRKWTAGEIDRLHQEHLLEVKAVQLERMALLRCLIRHHGLKRIYCEGLTANDLPNYKEMVAVLREMEQTQVGVLRQQLAEARDLKAKKIEAEITEMLDQHRLRLLELEPVMNLDLVTA